MKTNEFGTKILDNRYIGKVQLNADDLGGAGCSTWAQYRTLCDNIVLASYDRLHGKGVDANALGVSVAGLFTLFGVEAKATPEYQNRLMVATINRKPIRSQTLKDAAKASREAKATWEKAIAEEQEKDIIDALEVKYNEAKDYEKGLYTEPKHYYFELIPMLDKTKKHATATARKAIEDIIADIIAERDMMTAEELQAEAKRLADERKGRALRKKQEEKAEVARAVMDEVIERGETPDDKGEAMNLNA